MNTTINDTSDIDRLNQEAWDNRINNSNLALPVAEKAIAASRKINYPKGIAEGLMSSAFCLIRLARYKEAETQLTEASSIFESLNDKRGLATVDEYFGIIHRMWGNLGLSLQYLFKSHAESEEIGFAEGELTNLYQIGVTYRQLGNYEMALDYLFNCLNFSKAPQHELMAGYVNNIIGSIYFETADYTQALDYFQKGLIVRRQCGDKWGEAGSLDNIGNTHMKLGNWQQAINYCEESLSINRVSGDKKGQANTLFHLAEIASHNKDTEIAKDYSYESLQIRESTGDKQGEAQVHLFLANMLRQAGDANSDEEIFERISKALHIGEESKALDLLSRAHFSFYEYYKNKGIPDKALQHLELHIEEERSLHKDAINQKVLNMQMTHRAEESKKEAEILHLRNVELAGLYEESKQQKEEIEIQKHQVEKALGDLKSAQAQLIQSEKMASLGELTAGIAHEIQNPLNFVNNFSDINIELIGELTEQIEGGNKEEAASIMQDLLENEEKISHHGKRADAIVKAMLQHSRSSVGQKVSTDINSLVEEFMRLSYHGVRAKERAGKIVPSVILHTELDASLPLIEVIPQDIGRVLLNLFNNAFYAVIEKASQVPGHEPAVTVRTKKENEKLLIIVEDNGNGIPHAIAEKIFQPFFTTKPTGQGTGLGLSLSYDIIKAHGGELTIESEENQGARFIISLPAKAL